ncbi:hypothetical protein, partial [Pseudoalteromonas sp. S1650]|uniref:hypothetical protein n=1 Tax=Pseudoalteromonas sp. S1650 TaxID=579509 RepID=UPI001BB27F65
KTQPSPYALWPLAMLSKYCSVWLSKVCSGTIFPRVITSPPPVTGHLVSSVEGASASRLIA